MNKQCISIKLSNSLRTRIMSDMLQLLDHALGLCISWCLSFVCTLGLTSIYNDHSGDVLRIAPIGVRLHCIALVVGLEWIGWPVVGVHLQCSALVEPDRLLLLLDDLDFLDDHDEDDDDHLELGFSVTSGWNAQYCIDFESRLTVTNVRVPACSPRYEMCMTVGLGSFLFNNTGAAGFNSLIRRNGSIDAGR
jgi:hypothetical protein